MVKLIYLACFAVILLTALSLIYEPTLANPSSYLIEKTTKTVGYNGTLLNSTSEGSIEVELSNAQDVLQNVVITLSSTQGTNLLNTTAYAAVAASPDAGDRTKLYLSTNEGNSTTTYRFNETSNISLRLDYTNINGGKDLTPDNNMVIFTIFLSSPRTLNNVQLRFQANTHTYLNMDSMNILSGNATTGSVQISDSNGDGNHDTLLWAGNLANSTNITLTASINPGTNYDPDDMAVDIDSGRTLANYSRSSTFSGLTFSNRFSRAGIREGVELTPKPNWLVKGFIKNIGYGTVYKINTWSIYEVGSNNSSLQGTASQNLNPGDAFYTPIYDTGIAGIEASNNSPVAKPIYYSAYFDWEVVWGGSIYAGILEERMNMPKLYQIDATVDKRIDLIKNDDSGRTLEVTDGLRHIGHINLEIDNVTFHTDYDTAWTISQVSAFIQSGANVTQINISSLEIGTKNQTITLNNLSLKQNEVAYIRYHLTSPKEISDRTYLFNLSTQAITKSGTPFDKSIFTDILVPGVLAPAQGGGGGGGGGIGIPSGNYTLEILRKDANDYFITESVLLNNITYRIIDTGGKGMRDPVFFIYTPENSKVDSDSIVAALSRNGSLVNLKIEIGDNGAKIIGNESYKEYSVKVVSSTGETFAFYNNDIVNIRYYADLPFGTSKLITRAYGYNYYADTFFFEDVFTSARRENWMLKSLILKESPWETLGVNVGLPVKWIKTIEVRNPNEKSVRSRYSSKGPDGMLNAHVKLSVNSSTTDAESSENNGQTEFIVDIPAKEYYTYILGASTPPVLETKRESDMIDIKNNLITFNTLITLQNFWNESYENVTLSLPYSEVLSCNYNYTTSGNNLNIMIPIMKGGEIVVINLTTNERPPQLILNTDKLKYQCAEKVQARLIAVPNQTQGHLEIELDGPDNSTNNLYPDIISLDGIQRTNITIPLITSLSGNYTLYAFYRSDFQTILVSKENVEIECPKNRELPWALFLILAIIIVLIAKRKLYKKKTLDSELDRMTK